MKPSLTDGIYSRQPNCVERGVPVFIDRPNNLYVENYDQISSDHIASIDRGSGNPFIDLNIWAQLESNTLKQGRKYIKPGMTVLDVGVGTGRLLSHFPEVRRYGIDVSINYVERLINTGAVIAVGNVEELPYLDGSFDVVFCTDVLEHVENLTTAASELVRVLKWNGTLIVRVPYREDLSAYLQRDYPYRLAHLRNFDECSLRLLFERQLGLSTAHIDFDYCAMPSLLRLPLPRGKSLLTRTLFANADRLPALERLVHRLFRPLEVTMSFHKASNS